MHLRNLSLGLVVLCCLGLSACSTSKNQNPVASNDEVGKVNDDSFSSADSKPTSYTARQGDTLRKIAARPQIYGDPNLWPLIQEANADLVGQSMSVNKGVTLTIPRDVSKEQRDMAREKARQVAAASKMSSPAKNRPEPRVASPAPVKAGKPAVQKAEPVAEAPAAAAQPVPVAKKSSMLLPVLLVLLLILAALAAILFYFMRKDNKESSQD